MASPEHDFNQHYPGYAEQVNGSGIVHLTLRTAQTLEGDPASSFIITAATGVELTERPLDTDLPEISAPVIWTPNGSTRSRLTYVASESPRTILSVPEHLPPGTLPVDAPWGGPTPDELFADAATQPWEDILAGRGAPRTVWLHNDALRVAIETLVQRPEPLATKLFSRLAEMATLDQLRPRPSP